MSVSKAVSVKEEKSINKPMPNLIELRQKSALLQRDFGHARTKLLEIKIHEEIHHNQEKLLEQQAQELLQTNRIQQKHLDDAREQVWSHLQGFISKTNEVLSKNSHPLLEIENENDVGGNCKEQTDQILKMILRIKAEIEALEMYREYQEKLILMFTV